jgi:hypothetical protein
MPQMDLSTAQNLIEQVVENPDGPATAAITDRQIAQAIATVLVRNALLAVNQNPSDG